MKYQKYAFISRHQPTDQQISLAADQQIKLVPVGDANAFSLTPEWVKERGDFDGVVVVHPAAALRLSRHLSVGVFENGERGVTNKPLFKDLHIYDMRD